MTVARARKIQKFMSQPFTVAEVFTGKEGKFVEIADTIQDFKEVLAGTYDDIPDVAFYMVGGIKDVQAKAKMLLEETEAKANA